MSLRASAVLSRAPLACFVVMGMLWGTLAALLPDLQARFGLGDGMLGVMLLLTSVSGVVVMLAAPMVAGWLGAAALPVAAVAMGLAFATPALAVGVAGLALAMLAIGAASGFIDVMMNARVSTIEAARARPLMNLNHGAYSFAYAGGAALTGLARGAGVGPGPILVVAGCGAVFLAALSVERGATIGTDRRGAAARGGGALGAVTLLGGLVILVAYFAESAVEAWSALHIERTLGGNPAQGALGPALLGLTMGIGRLAGQGLAARIAPGRMMRAGLALAAAGAAVAALAPVPVVAWAGFAVLGLGVSVVAPCAMALIGAAVPEARAAAIARASAVAYAGFFIGPPLLGGVSDLAGLRAAFAVVVVILVAALPLIGVLVRRARS